MQWDCTLWKLHVVIICSNDNKTWRPASTRMQAQGSTRPFLPYIMTLIIYRKTYEENHCTFVFVYVVYVLCLIFMPYLMPYDTIKCHDNREDADMKQVSNVTRRKNRAALIMINSPPVYTKKGSQRMTVWNLWKWLLGYILEAWI